MVNFRVMGRDPLMSRRQQVGADGRVGEPSSEVSEGRAGTGSGSTTSVAYGPSNNRKGGDGNEAEKKKNKYTTLERRRGGHAINRE
jgi:hypothetical protein